MRDQIIGQHARALGRRVVDRRYHLDQPLIHGHFNAKTAKLAARLYLHVLKALGRQIGRMRVERCQHAGQCRFDKLLITWRIDIFRAHAFQNIAKQGELFIKRKLAAISVAPGPRLLRQVFLGVPCHTARNDNERNNQQFFCRENQL